MKRTSALLALLVLCTSLGTSLRAHAETPQERQIRIAALAAELEQKRAALRDLDNQQRSVTSSLGELDETLSKLADEQELANKALRQSRRELQTLEKQVGIDEVTLREVQVRLEKRLRVLYVDGEGGMLRALLGAESFEELSIRRRAVQTLAQNDATLTTEVARAAVLVRERKARAVLVQEEAAFTSRQIDDQRALILQARSEREAAITRIVGEKTLALRAAGELVNRERELGVLLEQLSDGTRTHGKGILKKALPWPVDGPVVQKFGVTIDPESHAENVSNGVHIKSEAGTSVHVVADGHVVHEGWLRGFGRIVIVDHGEGHHTLYAHLQKATVARGDDVTLGQEVGLVGDTESTNGTELYFELRENGRPRDPAPHLARR